MSKTEKWWKGAPAHEMTRSNGWVMARRPGCIPFTVFAREWDQLPSAEEGRRIEAEYVAARDGK